MDKLNFIIKDKFKKLINQIEKPEVKEISTDNIEPRDDDEDLVGSDDESTVILESDEEENINGQKVRVQQSQNGNDLSFNIDLDLNGINSGLDKSIPDSETSSIASDAEGENEKQRKKNRNPELAVDVEFDISVDASPVLNGRSARSISHANGHSRIEHKDKRNDSNNANDMSARNINKLVDEQNYNKNSNANGLKVANNAKYDTALDANLDSVIEESDINTPRTPRSGCIGKHGASGDGLSRVKLMSDAGSGYDSGYIEVKPDVVTNAEASAIESSDTKELRECMDRLERKEKKHGRKYIQRSSSLRENKRENTQQLTRRARTPSLERPNKQSNTKEYSGARPKVKSDVWRDREERRNQRRRSLAEADGPRPKLERSNSWVGKSKKESKILKDIEAKGQFEKDNSDTILMLYRIKNFMKKSFPGLGSSTELDPPVQLRKSRPDSKMQKDNPEEHMEAGTISEVPVMPTQYVAKKSFSEHGSPTELDPPVQLRKRHPDSQMKNEKIKPDTSRKVEKEKIANDYPEEQILSMEAPMVSEAPLMPTEAVNASQKPLVATVATDVPENTGIELDINGMINDEEDIPIVRRKTERQTSRDRKIPVVNQPILHADKFKSQEVVSTNPFNVVMKKDQVNKQPSKIPKLVLRPEGEKSKNAESLRETKIPAPLDIKLLRSESNMSDEVFYNDEQIKSPASPKPVVLRQKLKPKKQHKMNNVEIVYTDDPDFAHKNHDSLGIEANEGETIHSKVVYIMEEEDTEGHVTQHMVPIDDEENEVAKVNSPKNKMTEKEITEIAKESGFRITSKELVKQAIGEEILHTEKGETKTIETTSNIPKLREPVIPPRTPRRQNLRKSLGPDFWSSHKREMNSPDEPKPIRTYSVREEEEAPETEVHASKIELVQTDARDISRLRPGELNLKPDDDETLKSMEVVVVTNVDESGQSSKAVIPLNAETESQIKDDMNEIVTNRNFYSPIRNYSSHQMAPLSASARGIPSPRLSVIEPPSSPLLQIDSYRKYSSATKENNSPFEYHDRPINQQFGNIIESLERIAQENQGGRLGCMGERKQKRKTYHFDSDDSSDKSAVFVFPRADSSDSDTRSTSSSKFSERFLAQITRQGLNNKSNEMSKDYKKEIEQLKANKQKVSDLKDLLVAKKQSKPSISDDDTENSAFSELSDFSDFDPVVKNEIQNLTRDPKVNNTKQKLLSKAESKSSPSSNWQKAFEFTSLNRFAEKRDKEAWKTRKDFKNESVDSDSDAVSVGSERSSVSERPSFLKLRSDVHDKVSTWERRGSESLSPMERAFNSMSDGLSNTSKRKPKRSYTFDGVDYHFQTKTSVDVLTDDDTISVASTESFTPSRKISETSISSNEDKTRKKSEWAQKLSQDVNSTSPSRETTNTPFRSYKNICGKDSNIPSPTSSISGDSYNSDSLKRRSKKFSETSFEPIKREQKPKSFKSIISAEYGSISDSKENDKFISQKQTRPKLTKQTKSLDELAMDSSFKSRLSSQSSPESPKISHAFEAVKSNLLNGQSRPELFKPTLSSKITHENSRINKTGLPRPEDTTCDEIEHRLSFSECPERENETPHERHNQESADKLGNKKDFGDNRPKIRTISTDSGYAELSSPPLMSPVPGVIVEDVDGTEEDQSEAIGGDGNERGAALRFYLSVAHQNPDGYVSDSFVPALSDSEEDSSAKSLPDESMGDAIAEMMENNLNLNSNEPRNRTFNTLHHEEAVYSEFEKILKTKKRRRRSSKPLIAISRDS